MIHTHTSRHLIRPALVSAVVFMLVTGLAYPLLTTGLAHVLFPAQAAGSLVGQAGAWQGSAVIGQDFSQPGYFHPRPSATSAADPADASRTVDHPYNAALSGASNLGPTNRKLFDQVSARVTAYRATNDLPGDAAVPVDAVTASASGLDPDISLANARLQAPRVAHARGLPIPRVQALVDQHMTARQFGLLGEPRVNVLKLNLALDALAAQPAASK
ncbi:K+-transporting ATPase ATPase C chain [Luteibacter sp. Sphag1AF]|uniref:potassium-transporting ATPase subunit KdpC n=1 Tax=Luteibacter sp. Sphag1AF TaxID=2587031 RepID=UPI00160AFF41|nr:potassium-transporting ATPase subunit KdpC [Luteibacter sp. Sphag1AF]MBB3228682.1 K+-transporting ATPase ATPase C chain [Luteibacter sp. Sphag1AF]